MLTNKQVTKTLKAKWHNLKHIWCFDKEYGVVSRENLDTLLKQVHIPEITECNVIADIIKGELKKIQPNLLVGFVAYDLPFGTHAECITILEDNKIVFFDNKQITEPTNEDVFYVAF